METRLSEEPDKAKLKAEREAEREAERGAEYPTPEQQRDIIRKIEADRTTYSYFICKSWYHQWKAHVNYDDLGVARLEGIITRQPEAGETRGLTRRGTCRVPPGAGGRGAGRRGPGVAVGAAEHDAETRGDGEDSKPKGRTEPGNDNQDQETRKDDEGDDDYDKENINQTVKNNHVEEKTVNSTNNEAVADWETSDEHAAIIASSTPIKPSLHNHINHHPVPNSPTHTSTPTPASPSSPSGKLRRQKPKLTRVCRNSSKTEIDSSFEDSVELGAGERGMERAGDRGVKPINPLLAGLRAEGRREGDQPDANASMTQIFQQAKGRQVRLSKDRSDSSELGPESPRGRGQDSRRGPGDNHGQEERRDSVDKHVTFSMKPGPLEIDQENDQNNILINETVWMKLVQWYGISDAHELGRVFTNADKNCFEDFGVSFLSPIMTFTERPIRSLNIRDEVGYIEIQIRKMLQVPAHKSTRLWIREKDQKSKFQPLLDRSKSLSVYQEELRCDLSCILALELMTLDGMWPSGYPGNPVGRLDKYLSLAGHVTTVYSWEQQLEGAVQEILTSVPANRTEVISAITMTAKHILQTVKTDMEKSKEKMDTQTEEFHMMAQSLKYKLVTVQEKDQKLMSDLQALKVREEEFKVNKENFENDIAKLKELNKVRDSQVKLDVGGQSFVTSVETLTSDPDSLLAKMFSGIHPIKQEQDGSYFIDRDGTHFRFVLNFLREGNLGPVEPTNKNTLLELLTEAEYYNISGLITAIHTSLAKEGIIINSDDNGSNVPERTPSKIPLRRLYEKGQSISSDAIM